MDYAADSYTDIARRHAEIYGVAPHQVVPQVRWAIWYDADDRTPGWCRIDGITGKWSLCRSSSDALPSLFDHGVDAQGCIDGRRGGSWDETRMAPRVFEGW